MNFYKFEIHTMWTVNGILGNLDFFEKSASFYSLLFPANFLHPSVFIVSLLFCAIKGYMSSKIMKWYRFPKKVKISQNVIHGPHSMFFCVIA